MSFVFADPELVATAAGDLESLSSSLREAEAAASAPTIGVLAAAGDEVSTAIAKLFSLHGLEYQMLSAQAALLRTQIVETLNVSAGAYADAEAANAQLQSAEQDVLGVINAPTNALLGRPLIGNGTNGTTTAQGVGTPGGPGGILFGNGGHGGDSIATGVVGGAGGSAGLIGRGGTGGMGGWAAAGGAGGNGGLLLGNGGTGGIGGPTASGGAGGNAFVFGTGGTGGLGGEPGPATPDGTTSVTPNVLETAVSASAGTILPAGTGGTGGHAGMLIGNGGAGGQGGVTDGTGGQGASGHGLLGHAGHAGAAGGPAKVDLRLNGTKPQLQVSVDGGPTVWATADSAATYTVLPPQDVNTAALGPSIGSGTVRFGAGAYTKTETYNLYNAEVNFGNGMTTEPTTVGVITSVTQTRNGVSSSVPQSQWRALIGMGENSPSKGDFPNSSVQSLPGTLNEGVLINQPKDYFQFGPNPLPAITSVTGAPIGQDLVISIDGGPYQSMSYGFIDSAGAMGVLPSSIVPDVTSGARVPVGTTIAVATDTGGQLTPLYTQTITATTPQSYTPYVANVYNSGNYPYTEVPIYTSFSPTGVGTTVFDQQA